MEVTAISKSALSNLINPDSDRVLVLVQLNGGNDGLNTFVPIDQYANLFNARQNIILPESELLPISDTSGFHPIMNGMHDLYHDGLLNIVQSVAYPNQNRSHFRSKDIWITASESDQYLSSGWLGRHFDLYYPGYPENYPNDDYPDPFAITLGYILSETCQGASSNFSYAVANSDSILSLEETEPGDIDNTCYGMELSYIRDVVKQSNAYSDVVKEAFEKTTNTVEYPDYNLAAQLKIVANLIAGGLKTKVYVVSAGGYDTHANQVLGGSPTEGSHTELLDQLSQSISAFQKDITNLGVHERVVGMTFSEFGRRIKSNDGFGTDHGTAAPLFVFGNCVNGGITGENPVISDNVADNEGVAMQYDFRSVYATILMDWFEVEEEHVRAVMFEDFQHLPFLKDCSITSEVEDNELLIEATVYPNPTDSWSSVKFHSKGGNIRIELYDVMGSRIKIYSDRKFTSGQHEMKIDLSHLESGSYFIRIVEGKRQKTLKLIKN